MLSAGCWSLSRKPATLIRLAPAGGFGFESIDGNSRIYRQSADASLPVFFTAMQDCSFSRRSSPATAARQLLVGLKSIKIRGRKTITLGGSDVLRAAISAELDGRPLELVTYTFKSGGCVQDYILWRSLETGAEQGGAPLETAAFENYLASILPAGRSGAARQD